jgi:anti-sigma factor RsiW
VIEKHLETCPECASEVVALRSIFRSLREQSHVDHLPAEDLVAYQDGLALEGRRATIAAHLRECRECRDDLESLKAAAHRERAGGEGRAPAWKRLVARRGTAATAAAAAAVVLLLGGAALWRFVSFEREAPSAVPSISRVRFAPSKRGMEPPPRLEGRGPWEIEAILPLRAPATIYTARIRRADGPASLLFEAKVAADADGHLRLRLPRFDEPGHHILELQPAEADGEAYIYGFDVTGPP